jgi:hypothetical protein
VEGRKRKDKDKERQNRRRKVTAQSYYRRHQDPTVE